MNRWYTAYSLTSIAIHQHQHNRLYMNYVGLGSIFVLGMAAEIWTIGLEALLRLPLLSEQNCQKSHNQAIVAIV